MPWSLPLSDGIGVLGLDLGVTFVLGLLVGVGLLGVPILPAGHPSGFADGSAVVVVGRTDGFLVLGYRGDALAVVGGSTLLLLDLDIGLVLGLGLFIGLVLGLFDVGAQAVDEGRDLLPRGSPPASPRMPSTARGR